MNGYVPERALLRAADDELPPPRLTRPYVGTGPGEESAVSLEWARPYQRQALASVPSGKHRDDLASGEARDDGFGGGGLSRGGFGGVGGGGFGGVGGGAGGRSGGGGFRERYGAGRMPWLTSRRVRVGIAVVVIAINVAAVAVIADKTAIKHGRAGVAANADSTLVGEGQIGDSAGTIGTGTGGPDSIGPDGVGPGDTATASAPGDPGDPSASLTVPELPAASAVPAGQKSPAPGGGTGGSATTPASQQPITAAPTKTAQTVAPGSRSAYVTIQAESFSFQFNTKLESTTDVGGGTDVGFISRGDYIQYDNVDFGSTPATTFTARIASGQPRGFTGQLEIRIGTRQSAPVFGTITITNTADGSLAGWATWRTISTSLSAVTGVHSVFLTFTAGHPQEFANINFFTFSR